MVAGVDQQRVGGQAVPDELDALRPGETVERESRRVALADIFGDVDRGVQPDVVGTACPFCLTMFEDGIRAKDATEKLKAMDLAELVARSL